MTNQVVLDIDKTKLNISSQDLDYNNESQETLDCEATKKVKIGLNGKYTLEMCNKYSDENLVFTYESGSKAMTIIEKDDNQEVLGLLMPVLLTSN